jgi:hypothetical protein
MSEAAPAVSVCIRAFARPEGLRRAIASVLAQTVQDFEIVVSDDSGGMETVAREFRDPRVRYHRNPRPAGQVANIVTSFGLARGRYLALLDDDDCWLPGFLDATLRAFESDRGAGIVFTDVYLETRGRRRARRPALAAGPQQGVLLGILENWATVVPSAAVMRREVWEQGEREYPLEASAIGDATMWIRAALAGWGFHYIDEPLVAYAVHPGQISWERRMETRAINLFERFEFEDPACESLRRARLANARLAHGGSLLWRGRVREARRQIGLARGVAPGPLGMRGWMAVTGARPVLARVAASNAVLMMGVLRIWPALRPAVDPGARQRFERLLDGVDGWLGMREAWALHDAAFRLGRADPAVVAVEIGSWKGRSAIAIGSGLERAGAGILYAIDPHEGSRTHALEAETATFGAFRENVRRAGIERHVTPLREVSAQARARFGERSVGLLFIDGSHRYEDVVDDILGWLPYLRDGAVVAFHDAARVDVRRALVENVFGETTPFDRPRLVQNTLLVTRTEGPRGASRWSRTRGRILLQRVRVRARLAELRTRAARGRGGAAAAPPGGAGTGSR